MQHKLLFSWWCWRISPLFCGGSPKEHVDPRLVVSVSITQQGERVRGPCLSSWGLPACAREAGREVGVYAEPERWWWAACAGWSHRSCCCWSSPSRLRHLPCLQAAEGNQTPSKCGEVFPASAGSVKGSLPTLSPPGYLLLL